MEERRARWLVLLGVLALFASACGARVSSEQIKAAGASSPSQVAGGPTGAGDAGASADTGAAGSVSAGGATPTSVASSGGGTTPSGAAAQGGTPTTAAPAGGNGGATDVGVTADQIVLGNVSTLSGPVPGLFQGAVLGAQAVVAYQNSKGGLFGRKFRLDVRDDQFDTGQNRAVTNELIPKAFAFLGSFSLFDDAAADAVGKAGIPDLSVPLNQSRGDIRNNFSVAPADTRGAPTGPFEYFKQRFPDAVRSMGTLYGDVPAAKISHQRFKAAAESVGWKYVYERGYQATETDFTADVVRMRQNGVKGIYLVSTDDKTTARIVKALAQQGFKPQFIVANYMPTLISLGGAAVEGVFGDSPFSLFGSEDSGTTPEVALFNQWFQKVRPGAKPDLFAVYSWAEGRLLFQALEAAGPKATRADVLRELAKIPTYSANDLIGPAGPAAKKPGQCYVISQIKGGRYARVDPAKGYRCDGTYFRR
jgi:ABC-type branched-subunit amino acid transport system substrate-binding protein